MVVVGELATMGQNGHTVDVWAPEDTETTEHARDTFDEMVGNMERGMRGQGFAAFATDEGGGSPQHIKDFDPTAEKILLTPQMMGG